MCRRSIKLFVLPGVACFHEEDLNPALRAVSISVVVSPMNQDFERSMFSSRTARSIMPVPGFLHVQAILRSVRSFSNPLSGW